MEEQTAQAPFDPSSAAAYPRWVILEKDLKIHAKGSSSSTTSGANKTLATARTSAGHLVQVSLRLAEPPAVSCVCLQIPDVIDAKYSLACSRVVAAHGDSVLIEVSLKEMKNGGTVVDHWHFVYYAGAAAADPPRPPSLSLLPPYDPDSAGLLRHGDDELVVAHLTAMLSTLEKPERTRVAKLSLFRNDEWSVKTLPIRLRDDDEVSAWDYPCHSWNAVIPVGDRLLCWVDLYCHIVVLCDVFEETPRVQFLWLTRENSQGPRASQNVCATASGDALRFVDIFPRCCCGEAGAACCKRYRHAYNIHTWTMRIDGGAMEWVMDGVVDATELWALDAYKGLPCLPLSRPVFSMDDPDLMCFWLHQPRVDAAYWLMVNMRSKTIHSVSRHEGGLLLNSEAPIPSKVSDFFNSNRCSGSSGRKQKGIERPPPAIVDEQLIRIKRQRVSIPTNPTLQPASSADPSVQASEIFEAFQEIPSFGLDHDEIIKAYRILSRDNCRQFKTFIRLPKNVRKDWLSMEIKACAD